MSTKVGGYGLGLSIVSQLCKENNAEIMLDKSYNKGARFIIKTFKSRNCKERKYEKLINSRR